MTSACRTLTRRNRASQGPWRHRRGRAGRGAGWSGTASGTRVVAAPGWPPRWGQRRRHGSKPRSKRTPSSWALSEQLHPTRPSRVQRRDLLGGLVHDYHRRAHERIRAPYGLIPVGSQDRGLPAPPSKSTEPCAGCRCVGVHGHAVGHSTAGYRPTAVPAAVSGGPCGPSHNDDQLLNAAAGRLEPRRRREVDRCVISTHHLHECRISTEAGEAPVQSLSAGKRCRTP
jgi:hypothetical protein